MVKVTYLSLKAPHIGHLVWLRALKALGHEVKVASIYDLRSAFLSRGDILVTEGVRPTIFGSLQRGFYRCWASVACSPSILNPLINKIYSLPDLVIAVSSLVKDLVKNKAVVLYPAPPELETLLQFNVDHKEKSWVCYSGSFIPVKGVHIIPDIAYKLRREGIKVQFILAGGTEEEPLARLILSKAEKLGVKDYIKIAGVLSRVKLFELLSKCSTYLQPSLFDAGPISLVEAMALGVVPVVTKYVGFKDIVRHINPLLIRSLDPNDIAQILMTLLLNDELLREYSTLSRTTVQDILSFESILNNVEQLVEECQSI
jgi:glycosyltransferase involved in cell wall biosynthesis